MSLFQETDIIACNVSLWLCISSLPSSELVEKLAGEENKQEECRKIYALLHTLLLLTVMWVAKPTILLERLLLKSSDVLNLHTVCY